MKISSIVITLVSLFIVVGLTTGLTQLFSAPKQPATLIMFHNPECRFCQKFLDEVCLTTEEDEFRNTACPGYSSGKYPILIVTKNVMPDWVIKAFKNGDIKTIKFTPTFVLWNGKREVGRTVGFETEEVFYRELEDLIKKDRPQKKFYRVGKREAAW